MSEFRQTMHEILELTPRSGTAPRLAQCVLLATIVITVVTILASSNAEVSAFGGEVLSWVVRAGLVIFAIELGFRVWLFDAGMKGHGERQHQVWGRLRYLVRLPNLLDLLAIMPLIPGVEINLVVFRTFRMIRVLRFTPFGGAVESLGSAFYTERRALIGVFIMLMGVLVVASTMVFVAERDAQPEAFASIPHAMWWGLATLTTVGYGDVTPITPLGRLMGGFVTIIGVGMFALPAAILASGYTREFRRRGFVETWDLVAEVPLFSDLPAARIADLAAMLKPRVVPSGKIVVRKGEHADSMYFIVSGALEVELDPNPAILNPGDFFGEIALIEHGDRVATVVALELTRLLVLDAQDLARFLNSNPELRQTVKRVAAERQAALGGNWPGS